MRTQRIRFIAAVMVATALPSASAAQALNSPSRSTVDATGRDFNPKNFAPDSSRVDNIWLPLIPGTQFIFEGQATLGTGLAPHQVIFTVTDLTKVINGVRSLVMWDRDINSGVLGEAELAFESQDKVGNVWNMGEYPEEYDAAGKFTGAPRTWIEGLGDAHAGVAMRAWPRVGTSSYIQGFIPSIGFEDQGTVVKQHQTTCVPIVCFGNVLVVDETNLLSPNDGHQLKFHAPLVGVVRIMPKAGPGVAQEILDLVKVRHLGPKEMAAARAETLKLERHAYQVSTVYGQTSPMERIGQ